MPLERGTRLGPYQIESPIGAGGMGEACKGCVTGPAGVGSLVWV